MTEWALRRTQNDAMDIAPAALSPCTRLGVLHATAARQSRATSSNTGTVYCSRRGCAALRSAPLRLPHPSQKHYFLPSTFSPLSSPSAWLSWLSFCSSSDCCLLSWLVDAWVLFRCRARSASLTVARGADVLNLPRSTRMSGSIPWAWIERPDGVKYSAVVSLTPRSSFSGRMVCTEPLPKLLVPRTTARLWSCRAPATISEAEALPPLISTTRGILLLRPSCGPAVKRICELGMRPSV